MKLELFKISYHPERNTTLIEEIFARETFVFIWDSLHARLNSHYGADISTHSSKKRGNICKANTADDASSKFFVFNYEITFIYPNIKPFFKCKESKTFMYEARNNHGVLF